MNKFIFVCLFLSSIVNAKGLCYQQQDLISFNNIISSFNSLKPYLEENDLKKDCEQVGNYIAETHKLDKERHTNLYILYNGYGKHKIDAYNNRFKDLISDYNLNINPDIDEFSERIKNYKIQVEKYKKENSKETLQNTFNIELSSIQKNKKEKEKELFKQFGSYKFCWEITSSIFSINCRNDLNKLIDYVDPVIYTNDYGRSVSMSLSNDLKQVLTDPTYLDGLTRSLEILNEYEGKGIKNISLDNILTQAFKSNDEEASKHYVWKILGVYSSRGASVLNYTKILGRSYTVPLSILSELFNRVHFNNNGQKSGENLATLPKMKKNSCVYGKAYHFWMAARTAQKLKNEDKISAKRAFTAAYTSGAFYNFFGSGANERGQDLSKLPPDDVYVKSIRLSLLYQALGAYYGATHDLNNKIDLDVDKLYKEMIENSTETFVEVNEKNYEIPYEEEDLVTKLKKLKKNYSNFDDNLEAFTSKTGSIALYESLLEKID